MKSNTQIGLIHAEIELINGADLAMSRRGIIEGVKAKAFRLTAVVTNGPYFFAINPAVQKMIGLPVISTRTMLFDADEFHECPVLGPLGFRLGDRNSMGTAIVADHEVPVRMGRLALLALNLLIDTKTQTLVVNPRPQRLGGLTRLM